MKKGNNFFYGIGHLFIAINLIGLLVAIIQFINANSWTALIVLISCPFMAYAFVKDRGLISKNSTKAILLGILILSVFGSYLSIESDKNVTLKLRSIFLDGQIKNDKIWVEDEEDKDSYDFTPAHYENHYYFKEAPNQSKFVSSVIDLGIFILVLGIPFLTWFIMRKDLK